MISKLIEENILLLVKLACLEALMKANHFLERILVL